MIQLGKHVRASDIIAGGIAIVLIVSGEETIRANAAQHVYDRGSIVFGVIVIAFGGMLIGAMINKLSHSVHLSKVVKNTK